MDAAELTGLDFGRLETIEVRGTAIELFRAGEGAPLLFLHGIDGLDGSVEGLRALAKSFSVIAPSLPGFGGSQVPEHCDRVDDTAYFLLDMMNELGLDAPIIVGTSFGAWAACEMLTKEPGRASSLILASPLGLKTGERKDHWVADIFMLSKQELDTRLQAGPPGPGLFKMSEHQQRRALRNDEALSLFAWTPYMSNPKLGDRLHRISCPTLVVWGSEDAMVAAPYRERWRATLPQARHVDLPGAGHRSHADKPDELAALIAHFAQGEAK